MEVIGKYYVNNLSFQQTDRRTPVKQYAPNLSMWGHKYALLARLPDNEERFIALQSSSGFVVDFLQRYLNSHPGCKWDILKQELSARFALVSNLMHALTLLDCIRQGRNENMQIFAERLLNLAQQAFQDQG